MAVQPEYQWVTEQKMIKSTIGVITNVRPDHLDEMGLTLHDNTMSLSNTVPLNGKLVTVQGDVNQDGDFYDEGERGGDGYIEAADVIVSLKRATMMPGYYNIRRADVNYSNSTPIDNGNRIITDRGDATDALLFGNIEGHPGETVQVPVTLRRGEGSFNLYGLVSGFSIIGSDDEVPELVSEISFNVEIDGNSMDIPSGNEFLSLLLMDLADLAPNTETLLGTLDFTIPISADTEDIYYIYFCYDIPWTPFFSMFYL